MERTYAEYAARQAMELLAIDSPTGFTARAADWVQRAFEELGYTARRTAKGGVLVDLGGLSLRAIPKDWPVKQCFPDCFLQGSHPSSEQH